MPNSGNSGPAAGPAGTPPVVMQIVPSLVIGGAERGTIDIAQALTRAGAKALVVSSGGPMRRELERAGAVHVSMPVDSKNPLVMRANVTRMVALIEEHGVDIVHARSRAPAWSARAAARRTRCRFVTTFHGTYNSGNPIKHRYNAVMTQGQRVIAISNFIAEHIKQNYGLPATRIATIHRGVDLEIFDPAKVPAARVVKLATDWRLPDGPPVIMLPGRLTRWKGQPVFLDALARMPRDNYCAVLVGSDQGRSAYRSELEKMVSSRGLAGNVRIVNECRDMPAAFMLADVVVSASTDPEAFGRVIAEAQAMGRPVIATDHGGARETVIENRTGWLVPPGDAAALAGAIGRAVGLSPDERESFASDAIANVRRSFSKTLMCEKTLTLYRTVMSLRRFGDPARTPAEPRSREPAAEADRRAADG